MNEEYTQENIFLWGIRHLMTNGGTYLISANLMSPDDTQVLSGAVLAIAGIAWSYCKRKGWGCK